jgi:ribonuclease HI
MALTLLLKYALEKNVKQIQIYGDSSLVIKWMNGTSHILNTILRNLRVHIKEIVFMFESISFTHAYREKNMIANALSKECQYITIYKECIDGVKYIS